MENLLCFMLAVLGAIAVLLWQISSSLDVIKSQPTIDNSYKIELELSNINQSIKNLESTLKSELNSTNKFSAISKLIQNLNNG